MADIADVSARKAQLQAQMDASSERYHGFNERKSNAVKDALIRSGVISVPPDRIVKFRVEEDLLSNEDDPQFELTISVGGSELRMTVSQSKRSILYFSISGISYRSPADDQLTDTAEYYLVVSELLSNGSTLVDQLLEVLSSLAEEGKAIRSERNDLYKEKHRIETEERDRESNAEKAKLEGALKMDQIWLRQLNSRYSWSLPNVISILMIDKVAGSSFTATEMTVNTTDNFIKDVETKRFYRAGKTPAQILTGGYVPTYLPYGEFQERIAKPDGKDWLAGLLNIRK